MSLSDIFEAIRAIFGAIKLAIANELAYVWHYPIPWEGLLLYAILGVGLVCTIHLFIVTIRRLFQKLPPKTK